MKNKKSLFWMLSLFIFSIACFLLFCYHLDTDYFWHIKAGEYMFKNGVLTHDVFSWYMAGKYWMSHEWLFEVILYGLKYLFGGIHVYIYCILCIIGICSLTFFPNFKNIQKNVAYSLVFLSFFMFLMAFFVQARPHMISLCLLALTIWFLTDLYRNKESKKIYFLPIISLIWANVHGGSSNLPYLLCFLFFVGGLFSFQFKKIEAKKFSKKQLKKYFWVMILCMIAVCINIHGFKMFVYPYQNMMDKTMISTISEWQSTTLNEWYNYAFYAFLVFLMFTVLFSDKKIQWMDLLLMGFVSYLGLKSIRFWAFAPIVMSYIIFDYVEERKLDQGTYVGIGILSLFFIGCLFVFFPSTNSYYLQLDPEVISILKKEKPKRLYNMYDLGGELIYHDISVFVDGRADLYSSYNYEDYLHISRLERDYVSLIDKYDFDYFLVTINYPICTYLKYDNQYELIYQYKDVYLYKKIVNEG